MEVSGPLGSKNTRESLVVLERYVKKKFTTTDYFYCAKNEKLNTNNFTGIDAQ